MGQNGIEQVTQNEMLSCLKKKQGNVCMDSSKTDSKKIYAACLIRSENSKRQIYCDG